jgi:hypothetical protein
MKRITAERVALSQKDFWDWTPADHHRDTVLLSSLLLYEKMLDREKRKMK